ncbi:hypothetical protein [Caballeronia sp. LZ035]|uniref:hypothetical protein n=1 Tax=Caballeronia sp. LZ035 TaxID=3038568 RepID=UPI0028557800|nr:hypothetical protein [Caballeronia sp. LZ035]MDR5756073.1 hypothetical protein [Caballeronia sp. LZ035]
MNQKLEQVRKLLTSIAGFAFTREGPMDGTAALASTRWARHDATHRIEKHGGAGPDILIDQGDADEFLESQLKRAPLVAAAARGDVQLRLRRRADYGHSTFFISTFIASHLEHHARHLLAC